MAQKREKETENHLKFTPTISSITLSLPDPVPDSLIVSRPPLASPLKTPDPLFSSPEPNRRQVNRCSGCRRKVGLTGFRCRCGDLFCKEHRYSDRHDCSFDYKAAGREAIERENPVVRPAKLLKV